MIEESILGSVSIQIRRLCEDLELSSLWPEKRSWLFLRIGQLAVLYGSDVNLTSASVVLYVSLTMRTKRLPLPFYRDWGGYSASFLCAHLHPLRYTLAAGAGACIDSHRFSRTSVNAEMRTMLLSLIPKN